MLVSSALLGGISRIPACPDLLNHIIKRFPDVCGTSTLDRATRLRSDALFAVSSVCLRPSGPWWLVMDDLRDYFRMWSAPVYRWLSASVQRPMLEAARARRRASHRRSRNDDTHAAEKHQRQLAGSTNG